MTLFKIIWAILKFSSKILRKFWMKNNSLNQGQSLIWIIIVLVVVGLITGSLYYYLQKQIPEMPEIPKAETLEEIPEAEPGPEIIKELEGGEKPIKPKIPEIPVVLEEFKIVEPDTEEGGVLLLVVEDILYNGLIQELNTYSNDVKMEFGFDTIIKTFPATAHVLEIKSYVKKIYNNYELKGVLLIGNLPSAYSPQTDSYQDFIYQDIYDHCEYLEDQDAFDFSHPNCGHGRLAPFWVSRLTPNSSEKESLTLLKDYFQRNHAYRTGQYFYKQQSLLYLPLGANRPPEEREWHLSMAKAHLQFFNTYDENKYNIIDVTKENSDEIYLNEIRKPYEYETLFVNAHGLPTYHEKDITPEDIYNTSFFWAEFASCNVGRFTTKDYLIGKYLFEGKGLVALGPSTAVFSLGAPIHKDFNYALSQGLPIYKALELRDLGDDNLFGDPTLRMRPTKELQRQANDPIIAFSHSRLVFTRDQPKITLKIKNLGKSTLKLVPGETRFYNFKQNWPALERGELVYLNLNPIGGGGIAFFPATDTTFSEYGFSYDLLGPGEEGWMKFEFPYFDKALPGIYKGKIFFLSNDPVTPIVNIPFEAIVE